MTYRTALRALIVGLTGSVLTHTPALARQEMNRLTASERADGWELLFDGDTTDEWRGFRQDSMPDGWKVVDGALTRVAPAGDIITKKQFKNFDLQLEWKIAEAGNSGIMFRVTEDQRRAWLSGPEMQVLDDARHRDGQVPETSAGSNYGLHAPKPGAVRAAGSWNSVRLLVRESHVEHWLNGVKVVEYELESPEWERLVSQTKFDTIPSYGRQRTGHIALQDHGDRVAYRNIKIKRLP